MQVKMLDREIKLLYGLDVASWKFWLNIKETLLIMGLRVMPRDEAFYYLNGIEILKGACLLMSIIFH